MIRCGRQKTCRADPVVFFQNAEIFPIDAFEHLGELMGHFHLPGNGQVDMLKLMQLIDRMVNIVPVYRLRCTNDISAAETAIKYFGL